MLNLVNFDQNHDTSHETAPLRVLSIESKVRKLCIAQGFTKGVKGLCNKINMCKMSIN